MGNVSYIELRIGNQVSYDYRSNERNTGITSFSFLCRQKRIVGQKVSTNCCTSALPDCFPSSSCLLLREYWNVVPSNTNIRVKKWRYDCHPRLGAHFLSHNALCAQQRKLKLLMPALGRCAVVEMLGGRKVPSGYYVLVKLASQLSSLYSTDIREALVGVGLVVKNERSGIATLDKGICWNSCLCASVCEAEFPASDFQVACFLTPKSLISHSNDLAPKLCVSNQPSCLYRIDYGIVTSPITRKTIWPKTVLTF